MRFAIVTWRDSWANTHAEATPETAQEMHKPAMMQTTGWVLVDDEVGMSLFNERTTEDDQSYRGRTLILRENIISVQDVNLDPPKPRKKRVKKVTTADHDPGHLPS